MTETLDDILIWYAEAGVDVALVDEAINRFEESEGHFAASRTRAMSPQASGGGTSTQNRSALPAQGQRTAQPVAPKSVYGTTANSQALPNGVKEAIAAAKRAAEGAGNLTELRLAIQSFEHCDLRFAAKATIVDAGKPAASLMLITDAPGAEDDENGVPISGLAQELLGRILHAVHLDLADVTLVPVIPWRSAGRAPSAEEVLICRPFLMRHIALHGPSVVVSLGGTATSAVLNTNKAITNLRGRLQEVVLHGETITVLPTFHPAQLLKNPSLKRLAWKDWQKLPTALASARDQTVGRAGTPPMG
ncbi:MAG: uracil-DNA glycosylase [Pseudomonadota bacterium]